MRARLNLTGVLIAVAGIAACFYIIYRALILTLTIDEAHTWLYYCQPGGFFPEHPDAWLANHHLLNSWLMKVSSFCFGDSEFSLRLPNVVAGIIYISFAAALARKLKPNFGWLLFLGMVAHPYLLQYFSLARGYGLSFAGMAGGMYFAFLIWTEERSVKRILLMNLCFLLGVLSNLTISFYVLPFLGLQLLFLFKQENIRQRTNFFLYSFIGLLVIFLLTYFHAQYLKQYKALHYGEHYAFWNGTIPSLIYGMLMGAEWTGNATALIKMFFRIVLGVSILVALIQFFKHKRFSFAALMSISFVACILLIVFMFYFGNTLYPFQRTALYLVPPFFLMWFLVLHELSGKWTIVGMAGGGATILLLLFNVSVNSNVCHTFEWEDQQDLKAIALDLKQQDPDEKQTVGINWYHDEIMNYYRVRYGGPKHVDIFDQIDDINTDWYFCDKHYVNKTDLKYWKFYKAYPHGCVLFYKRKNLTPAQKVPISD